MVTRQAGLLRLWPQRETSWQIMNILTGETSLVYILLQKAIIRWGNIKNLYLSLFSMIIVRELQYHSSFCPLGCGKTLWLPNSSFTNSPQWEFLNLMLDKCDHTNTASLPRCQSSISLTDHSRQNGIKAFVCVFDWLISEILAKKFSWQLIIPSAFIFRKPCNILLLECW